MPDLKAVIWDFDGTFVDTEPIWASTEIEMVGEHGVVWKHEELALKVGQHVSITARDMAEAVGHPEWAEWFFDALHERIATTIRENDLPYLPGVRDLLDELHAAGIRCAVVTASAGRILDAARDRMPSSIDFILTADEVEHTKPHPEPYLRAFERLGVRPEEAMILEDSVPGTTSALDAGGYVLAVPQKAEVRPHPRMRIRDGGLSGIGLAELTQIWKTLRRA